MPAVVLVEVPTRPTPPPLPEQTPEARPSRSAPARREISQMDLSARGQPRRTNRPRHPSSVMAGLTLTVMGLLFVGLLGVSGATWLVTSLRPPMNNGPFVQQQQPPGFLPNNGGVGDNVIVNPGPPGMRFNDKLATKIALKNRLFITRSFLTNKDPLDPVSRWGGRQLPCKVFLIDLEQGKQYTIEYLRAAPVNNHFDPYLRVESQDGQRLVENDDIVQAFNNHIMDSRIVFVPNRTGTYRIFCTLFQHSLPEAPPGQWQFTLSVRENGAGVLPTVVPMLLPPVADVPLRTAKQGNPRPPAQAMAEGDISVTTLTNPPGVETKADACWSADRKAFFVLYNHPFNVNSVARIAVNGLVEERRLPLTRPGGAMCLSSQGLVVTLPSLNEVWLISTNELKVIKRFGAVNPHAVASSPDLKYAYVVSSPAVFKEFAPNGLGRVNNLNPEVISNGPARRGLIVLDLQDGSARFQDVPCQSVVVSPNGSMLFAMDEDALHSFEIQADGVLLPKQTGGRLGFQKPIRHVDVSSDSKLVCVSGSVDPTRLPNHPVVGPSPAYVYPVGDLRKPVIAISTGPVLGTVGIDAKTSRVFTYAAGKPVVVFDMDGRRLADFALPNAGLAQDPSQFLVHPDGNKVLIRFPSKLCLAVFKADVAPLVKADPKFPTPSAVKDPESFAGKPFKRGAFTYRELPPLNPGAIDPCWDADGQAFFQMDADGTLTRVQAGDFLPKLQLAIGRPVSAMALSASGLLVALRDEPEIWIIDARTLKVQRSIARPSPARFLASHPKLSLAAAVGAEVVLLDLAGQGAVRGLPLAPEPGQSFESPALTPDGTFLFLNQAGVGSSKVLRVRIAPDRLIVEDTRVTPVKASHVFCVTADGKHVAWFSPLVANKKQETAFYAVGDWKAAAFTLPERARAMGAAPDGSLVVNTHQQSTLLFAQPADAKAQPTPLQFPASHVRSFAVHPRQPGVFLASTGKKVFHVQR
jgi:hypothetical protein